MNIMKSILMAAGTASVALSPVIATAATATTAPISRVAPASAVDSELRGRNSGLLIGLAAAAAIIVAIVLIADGDDDPVSP